MKTGNLHDGWTCVKLGDVVKRTSKQCIPELNARVRWIGADHLDEGDLSVRRWSTTDDPMFPPTFKFAVPSGSVLVHSRNPRKVAILRFDAITGEKLFCLSPVDQAELDSHFLAIQLQSDHFLEFVGRWLSGSVNKFLNWTALARYEFALPPIDEQRQLCGAMRSIDAAISGYAKVAQLTRSWISSYFYEQVADCERIRLGDVAAVELGRQRAPKYESGSNMLHYVRAANVKHGRLVLDDVLRMHFEPDEVSRLKLRRGDVLVTEGCGSLTEIGANAVWHDDLPGDVCFQNTVLRLRSRGQLLDPVFLQLWAEQAYVHGEFAEIATGTSIYHLGAKRTAEMQLPLPSIEQQRQIVGVVDAARKTVSGAQTSGERLRAFRRTYLRDTLMRGGLHV